ncbi:MAG: hypothetical protein E7338_02755 [Clostridiales bacterium]|nr:hypothetical protein [Clostridiales bacterium]
MEGRTEDKAELVIKRRQKEYIRDTLIIIMVIAVFITGIVLAIRFFTKPATSIVLYGENGEPLGTYSKDGDVNIPNKKGYQSIWVSEDGTTYESIDAALSNGENSIKQSFAPIEYTLTLYAVGGTLANNLGYEYHEAIEGQENLGAYYTKTYTIEDEDFDLPAIKNAALATKKGCSFAYWSNVNYVGKNYTVENLKATEVKTLKTSTATNLTYYAAWKDNISTIHVLGVHNELMFFEEQKETSLISEEALRQKTLSLAPLGFTFVGFYADSHFNTPFDFSHEIDKQAISVFTKWQALPFTLTFKDTNDTLLQEITYKTDEEIAFYDYSSKLAPGKTFDGWLLDNVLFEGTLMPASNITLYPALSNIPYTITWIVDENRQESETYFYGDEPHAPSTLDISKEEDEGHTYVFDGWDPSLTSVTQDKEYTAQFRAVSKKFTYSFEVNGEEIVSPTLVDYNTSIIFPSYPTSYVKDGYEYTFNKWVIKDTNITPTTVTQDMVIEATFNSHILSYTVTWVDKDNNIIQVSDSNNLVDSLTIEYGTIIDLNLGYSEGIKSYQAEVNSKLRTFTFNGWTIGGVFYASNMDGNDNPIETNFTIKDNTTIKASYEVDGDKSYYVLLYENGETLTQGTYYVEDYEDLFAQINSIERSKEKDSTYTYTFDGWYFDNSGVETKLTSSSQLNIGKDNTITLKEKFESHVIPYYITWKFGDDDEVVATYKYGDTLDPTSDLENESKTLDKSPTISTTYTFIGWNYTSDIVAKTTTYIAQYEEHTRQYTYTFYIGSNISKTSTIDYNSVIIAPVNPQDYAEVDYSYAFVGWFEDINDSSTNFVEGTKITKDVEYYAKFNATINQYTYTFFMDDGETVYETQTVDFGTIVSAPANPTKDDTVQYTYEFTKWVTLDGEDYEDNQELHGDVSYKAVFTPALRKYTYTFFNGEDFFVSNKLEYGTDLDISDIATPEKAAIANKYTYEFAGWYLNSSFTGDPVEDSVTITGDIEFFAKFNEIPVDHTITFVTGEGATPIDPIVVGYNQPIVAPSDPTKLHYTFVEWDNEIPATMPDHDLEFTAVWTPVNYTITYNLYGGSATQNIKSFNVTTLDEDLVLKVADDSTKDGYTLTGWSYNGNSISSIKDTGVIGNLTIDAVFVANTYEITYKPVLDVEITPNKKTVTYDLTYGELPTLTKHGYTFIGWYLDSLYTTQITSSSTVKILANTEIFAKWELTPYYVHGYIGNTKVAEFTFDIEHSVALTPYENEEYDFSAWYLQDIYDKDVAISTFTTVDSYSDTTGDIITKVYALVKPKTLTISGNQVTAYSGTEAHVVIPRIWNDIEITTIATNAFRRNNNITSVDTTFITNIQEGAFSFCMNLSNVDLSNVITIGDEAFASCEGLTSINLSSATSIGEFAFAYSSIEEITISSDLTTLGDYAFYKCNITAIHFNGTKAQFEALVNNSNGNINLTWDLVC